MNKKIILTSLMMFLSGASLFASTTYNTSIKNTASLTFKVSGTEFTDTSNQDEFVVDRRVDLSVVTNDTSNIIVNPGDNVNSNTKPLTFTIKNITNGRQDFKFSATQRATGSATLNSGVSDSRDFPDIIICDNDTCSNGDISNQNVQFDNEGDEKTYYLFAKIEDGGTTIVDGDAAGINFIATAVEDGTTTDMTDDSGSADVKGTVQIVFADGTGSDGGDSDHDGKFSAFSAYQVESAVLSLVKNSCIIKDPINGTNNPKRIPGSTVRYTLEVANTGNFQADDIVAKDTLTSELVFDSSGIAEIRDEACNCLNPAGSVVSGDTVTNSNQEVEADYNTINGNSTKCAYFETTVQ